MKVRILCPPLRSQASAILGQAQVTGFDWGRGLRPGHNCPVMGSVIVPHGRTAIGVATPFEAGQGATR